MPLLTNGNTEFSDSAGKTFGTKSIELREVLRSLEFVQRSPISHNLVPLWKNIQIWKDMHPKETDPNGKRGRLLPTLEAEIIALAGRLGCAAQLQNQADVVAGHRDQPAVVDGENLHVVNRHRLMKTVANMGHTVTSTGLTVAGTATGVTAGSLGMAMVAGGAAGLGTAAAAAGGLIVVPATGLALTVGSVGLSARSWYKTSKHIHGLDDITRKATDFECEAVMAGEYSALEHRRLIDEVLPYIGSQKRRKRWRKRAGVTVIGGLGATGYNAYRKVKKTLNRTVGHERAVMARTLTTHFITHNCGLADAIISELLSPDEMEILKRADFTHIYGHMLDKMQST